MPETPAPDGIRKRFAGLTGNLEDAALMASKGQSARTIGEARRCCDDLAARLDRVLTRLHGLKRRLA